MFDCNPCLTHADTKPNFPSHSISEPSRGASKSYFHLSGSLLCCSTNFLFMHDPLALHLAALKRIICYLKGTLHHGLIIYPSKDFSLTAYSDADWAGCPDTRRSTSGYCVFLGNNLISWCSKYHGSTSRSSAEAEYQPKPPRFINFLWIFVVHQRHPLLFIVITSRLSTSLLIWFIIKGPNMLRSTFTLCMTRLHPIKSGSCIREPLVSTAGAC